MFPKVLVAFISASTSILLLTSQSDEQELEKLCHNSEEFVVKVKVELVVKFLVGSFSERLDDVFDGLSD